MIAPGELLPFAAAALIMVLTPGPNMIYLVSRSICEGAQRGWEVEVVSRRDSWWRRWLRAWREERQARLLAQLDQRILRDIGLDAGSGDPLAARADAYRQQEARRIAMARLGLM